MATISKMGRLLREQIMFFNCDLQLKFLKRTKGQNSVTACAQMMALTSSVFQIPIVSSEFLPEKFGHLITEDSLLFAISKQQYSMYTPETIEYLKKFPERNQIVLYGLEAHITVQQTALDLLENGFDVHLLVDGMTSIHEIDRKATIKRLQYSGCWLWTAQSMMFEILRSSEDQQFKQLLKSIQEHKVVEDLEF